MFNIKRPPVAGLDQQKGLMSQAMQAARATPTADQPKPITPGAASDVAVAEPPSQKPTPIFDTQKMAPSTRPVASRESGPGVEYDYHPKATTAQGAVVGQPPSMAKPAAAPSGSQQAQPKPQQQLPGLAKPDGNLMTPYWRERTGGADTGSGQAPGTTPPNFVAPDLRGVNTLGRAQVMDWRSGFNETRRDATNRQVNANELTSDQLNRLLDENGRYLQGARLRAREGAAGRGMLMSSVASGSAERAAIDAGMPIASQDAQTYFQTARDNMEATNQFALQDQAQGRQLLGQQVDLDFRGQESQMDRGFRREEGAIERNWRSGESSLDRGLQSFMQERGFRFQGDQNALERELRSYMQERGFQFEGGQNELNRGLQRFLQESNQNWQSGENQTQRSWQSGESQTERNWRSGESQRDRDFTGQQNEEARSQQRFALWTEYNTRVEERYSNLVQSIMGNPNLTPAQQEVALNNAQNWFRQTREAGNALFAAGVPEIFFRPYPMQQPRPPGAGQPPPGGANAPPPAPGTQPVIGPTGGGGNFAVPAPQPQAPVIMGPP
jgi:hypothetical protein